MRGESNSGGGDVERETVLPKLTATVFEVAIQQRMAKACNKCGGEGVVIQSEEDYDYKIKCPECTGVALCSLGKIGLKGSKNGTY